VLALTGQGTRRTVACSGSRQGREDSSSWVCWHGWERGQDTPFPAPAAAADVLLVVLQLTQ
jgi:hypothetical protein